MVSKPLDAERHGFFIMKGNIALCKHCGVEFKKKRVDHRSCSIKCGIDSRVLADRIKTQKIRLEKFNTKLNSDLPNEEWKPITGYEGMYMVSNMARVKSCDRITSGQDRIGTVLKQQNRGGYMRVNLQKSGSKKWVGVHRIMMIEFAHNPNNYPVINHINGIRNDNSLSNLEWCTHSRNVSHAFETGLKISAKGTRHGMCKLSENDVLEIRKLIADGKNNKEIGDLFNVSKTHIGYIKSGKLWSHL